MSITKETIYDRIKEMGFNTNNFNEDYQMCIDNYSQEYDVENPEKCSDFENYCVDNWTPEPIGHIENRGHITEYIYPAKDHIWINTTSGFEKYESIEELEEFITDPECGNKNLKVIIY